jgi:hypothetical protein
MSRGVMNRCAKTKRHGTIANSMRADVVHPATASDMDS